MKVLYCASEVVPIIKVGGLGDVAGSLPKALARLGVDIRIVVPKYEDIQFKVQKIEEYQVEFARQKEKVGVWQTVLPNSDVPVYLLENETYISKDGHQAFAGTIKETERFAFFSKAIAEILNTKYLILNTNFDLLHLNDWHTSLVPLLLSTNYLLPSLLTIHNLSYQGIAPVDLLEKLGLQNNACSVLRWDAQNRDIDILMEGIIHADFVNTVSPTYAKEIMTKEYGGGIEEVLKAKEGRVAGILNGIDYEVWNPEADPWIKVDYTQGVKANTPLRCEGKKKNKKALQKELGLTVGEKIPLLVFIGRLEPKQKGLDILYEAMEKLLPEDNFQFVLLGTGDKEWETKYLVLSSKYQANFKFINRFDEKMAHQLYAGADIILIPSRFEPCGLPQMIAMRYGTLPLVRRTGGLADTVIDGENGFVFEEYSSKALVDKIEEALDKLKVQSDPFDSTQGHPERSRMDEKLKMIEEAMSQDFSWKRSAKEYLELYKKIITFHNSK